MFKKRDFLSRKDDIVNFFRNNGVSEDTIAGYASTSGIPIKITCEFLIEEFPEHRKMCIDKIYQLNEFYGTEETTCGSCEKKCYQAHCVTETEE